MARFDRILIANRGEIACRIIRTARRMGLQTVAVYSEADRESLHVRQADAAVLIGPAAPAQSYLDAGKLIAAAQRSGAQAVHPGYGFLSERAEFAAAVREAGLQLIGPTPEAMAAMGNKASAKRLMLAAGVPCVPGYQGDGSEASQSDACLIEQASRIGLPIMIKAAAGGGGRGMRLVQESAALPAAIASARSEALNAFGSGELLLEKAVLGARHVEIQIFGDAHGQVVHLGERDCSLQRRHQKLIEESPSPAVDEALRQRMGAAAVAAGRAVAYCGAGTVEFLLDGEGRFYFLEMNTRLQVEHPVTEAVYDLDLVEWQIRVAQGEPLPLTQAQIDARRRGWAIEARLCSEDVEQAFAPQTGTVLLWREPAAPVRVESALETGSQIASHYDSMQAKLIVHGVSREAARQGLLSALAQTRLLGLHSNRDYLRQLLAHPAFVRGEFATDFIPRYEAELKLPAPDARSTALAAFCSYWQQAQDLAAQQQLGPELLGWHSVEPAPAVFRLRGADGKARQVSVLCRDAGGYELRVEERSWTLELLETEDKALRCRLDGLDQRLFFAQEAGRIWLDCDNRIQVFEDESLRAATAGKSASDGSLRAHSDGRVAAVLVKAGDRVQPHQALLVLEAMKLEFQLSLPVAGEVEAIEVKLGEQVKNRQLLLRVKLEAGGASSA